MATILAFPSRPSRKATTLERLEGNVTDVALVYKSKHGRVKIERPAT